MQISNRAVKYLVLSGFALFLGGQVSRVNAQSWYNTAWAYRSAVTITNSSGGTLTNFQVHVTLDASFNFSKALSTGADLRVANSDGTTLLSFWTESWNQAGSSASIWVKIPSIPIAGTTIYLYYGNPAATSAASSGSATFDFFDDFEGTPTAPSSYWTLGSAATALVQDTGWETSPPHSMSVVVPPTASNGGFTYWAYYGVFDTCAGVGLARSTNLTSWTKYASNPIFGVVSGVGNARWPSVVAVTSPSLMYYMVYEKNYCAGSGSIIELATSPDGITFTDSKVIVPAGYNSSNYNQNPFLYVNPNDAANPYYLYYYSGGYEIHARKAALPTGLDTASDVTVLTSPGTLAAPNVYYNSAAGLYFLSVETYTSSGVWNVDVFTSTSPTSGFKLLPGNPIMSDNSACMNQWVFPASTTTLHTWYCNLDAINGWTVQHRTATLTATAGTAGRASVNTPNSTLWTLPLRTGDDGGARGAWTIVTDTQQDGTSGKVAKGVTTDRQILLSTFSGGDYVLEAYGKQLDGVVWGLGVRGSDWENYYSLNLSENLDPSNNLFLYSWINNGGPYATGTLGQAPVGTINLNSWYKLTEKVHSSLIDVYKDGVFEITGSDSNLTTGGVALYGEANSQAEYNNVLVRKYASADPTTSVGSTPSIVLSTLALNPTSVLGGSGNTSTGTLTLAAAASGSLTVSLSSNSPTVASVPSSVSFTSGQTSRTFTATTFAVATTTVVTITATYNGASLTAQLTVNAPNGVPTITSLSPSSALAGAAAQTLTINGTNFLSTSTVTYNGASPSHTATFVDATHLTIPLTTGDQATAGLYPVVVTNPAPGGGVSSPFNFTVNNLVPTVTSLSPSSANAGAAAQTLTITGTNFLSTSTVTYNSVAHTPAFVDATHLTISLTTADQATGGTYPVVVTNPTPGGGSSIQLVNFTVSNLVPTITSLSPPSGLAGAAAQTLTINGTNFVSTSTVTYNGGAPRTPGFVNSTQLTLALTTGDQATAGTYAVVVTNPAPGGGSSIAMNFIANNPVPTITTLSPASVVAGAAAQTLTINGTNFLSTSTVTYSGGAHTATFVSSTRLTIPLTTGDQATTGTYPVVVTNPTPGGGDSTPVNFTVNNPVPTITSLTPSTVNAGAAAETLTINGTNFLSTSTVTYNSVAHTPTFVDSTHLTISLSVADQATGGNFPVVVTNPTPGGGASTPMSFTVNNPVPTIVTLSPPSALAGAAAQTLTINGTDFVSTSTVTYNGPSPSHTATFVDSTHLTISLTVADQAAAGNYPVVVTNSAPGGGTSNSVNFTLNNGVPTITSLSPPSAVVGSAGQTVTIIGTNFVSTSTVTYNGPSPSHTATFVDSTHLTISLSTSDLETAGAYPVVVTNPTPGGGPSNSVNFGVGNPIPTITSLSPSSALLGAAAQTLTITGTNFLSTPSPSTVTYNSVAHTPTFVDAQHLTISLSVADQATAGTYPIVVTNPTPGGGASTPVDFTVNNPVPAVTTLSPSSSVAGAAAQTMTITGTNFVAASTVTYGGAAHAATFVNSTQLTLSLSTSDQATAGTYPIVVTNPTPGGGASSPVNFTIQDFSVQPSSGSSNSQTVTAGASAIYNLSIDSPDGLTGSVGFTCTGAPSQATCTVNSPVTIPGSTTVTVSTTARSAVLMRPKPPTGPWIWLWMLALLAAVGVRLMAGRRLAWNRAWAPLAVAMLSVALWAGCGGGGGGGTPTPRGTPAGTYSLTVTGTYTSGTTTVHRNITLTLKVN